MSNNSATLGEQVAIRAVLIVVLWGILAGLSAVLVWNWEWYFSLGVSACVVLCGEILIRTVDGLDFL